MRLVDEVAELLKKKIVGGEWEVGEKIPSECSLGLAYGVSRNTIRGALSNLSTIGLIETKHGSGSFVRRTMDVMAPANYISVDGQKRLVDVLEYRKVVEAECAYLASKRHTEEEIATILKSVDMMQRSVEDPQSYTTADLSFHLNIAKASKNPVFYNALLSIQDVIVESFLEMNSSIGARFSLRDHVNIAEAIQRKESDLAKALMYQNIERSINVMKG